MKRTGDLYNKICEFDNIYLAYRKSSLGHKDKHDVLEFLFNYERKLFEIQEELINKTYKTGKYKSFYINDPKRRLIMALPFRDRVVHHALCNVIEPIFEKSFIYDSYACRMFKGAHKGIERTQKFINSLGKNIYVLKCDINKYFYSINHSVLKNVISGKIKCKETLWLIDEIIDSNNAKVGIPIGNLTSQLFANIYLNELDHYVKEELRIKHYIRYMDDFIVLSKDKDYLWAKFYLIKSFIEDNLKLRFNNKTKLFPLSQGLDFLGYRQFYDFRLLRKRCIRKTKRKFRKFSSLYQKGEIGFDKINQSVQSFIGHAKWANSWRIRENILNNLKLTREVNV